MAKKKKKLIGFPFAQGIDQVADIKFPKSGILEDCENGEVLKTGAISHRLGFEAHGNRIVNPPDPATTAMASGKALGTYHEELILFDGQKAYSKTAENDWIDKGDVQNLQLDYDEIASNPNATSGNAQVAVIGDVEVYAWVERALSGEGSGIAYNDFEGNEDDINYRLPFVDAETIPDWSKYLLKYMVKDRITGTVLVPETDFANSTSKTDISDLIRTDGLLTGGVRLVNTDYTVWLTSQQGSFGLGNRITVPTEVENDDGSFTEWLENTWLTFGGSTGKTDEEAILQWGSNLQGTPKQGVGYELIYDRGNQGSNVLYQQPGLRVVALPEYGFVYFFFQSAGGVSYTYMDCNDTSDLQMLPVTGESYYSIDPDFPQFDIDYLQTDAAGGMENGGIVSIMNEYTNFGTTETPAFGWTMRRKVPTSTTDPTLIDTVSNAFHVLESPSGAAMIAKVANRQAGAGLEVDGNCVIRVNIKGIVTQPESTRTFDGADSQIMVVFPDDTHDSTIVRLYDGSDFSDAWGDYGEIPAVDSEGWDYGEGINRRFNLNTGFGYDDDYIYLLTEVTNGERDKSLLPDRTDDYISDLVSQLTYTKWNRDNNTLVEQRALQIGVSCVSDAIMEGGKPFWWVTHNVGHPKDLSGMTAMISSDGMVYSHWGVGRSAVNFYAYFDQYKVNITDNVYGQTGVSNTENQNKWTMPFMVGAVQRIQYEAAIPDSLTVGSRDPNKAVVGISEFGFGANFQEIPWFKPGLFRLDFDPARPFKNIDANNVMLAISGMLHTYAGKYFTEHSFLQRPTVEQIDNKVRAYGDGFPVGTWKYLFLYEDIDEAGNIHYSRPSDEILITENAQGNGFYYKFKINTLQLTNRRNRSNENIHNYTYDDLQYGFPVKARISVYRTNNDSNYYFLHDTINMDNGNFSPKYQFVWTDSVPDDHDEKIDVLLPDIASPDVGAPSYPVPGPIDMCRHKDNLLITTSFMNSAWTSLKLKSGYATHFPMGLTPFFLKKFERTPTHIESNGMQAFVFTDNAIWTMGGEGPNVDGTMRFGDMSNISAGVGIQSDGFAANTPRGVFFSTQTGFYLISPNMQIGNIGALVEDFINNPVAGDPIIDQENAQILIPMEGGLDSDGDPLDDKQYVLIYNYAFKLWSRWSFDSSDTGYIKGLKGAAAFIKKPLETDHGQVSSLFLLSSDGTVWERQSQGDTNAYCDIDSLGVIHIKQFSIKTGWIQWPEYGRQFRMHRFKLIGELHESVTIGGIIFRDFNEPATVAGWEPSDAFVITLSEDNENNLEPVSMVVKPTNQKMVALKYEFIATPGSGTNGKGFTFSGIQMEVSERQVKAAFSVDIQQLGTGFI